MDIISINFLPNDISIKPNWTKATKAIKEITSTETERKHQSKYNNSIFI